MMSDRVILIDNIDEIHTTEMGADRIRRNLKLENVDVVERTKLWMKIATYTGRAKIGTAKLTV